MKKLKSIFSTKKGLAVGVVAIIAVFSIFGAVGISFITSDSSAVSGERIPSSNYESTDNYIGETQAEEIALKDAGISREKANNIKTYLDYDDNKCAYDVEITTANCEYGYEIDALSGTILEKIKEKHTSIDTDNGSSNNSNNSNDSSTPGNGYHNNDDSNHNNDSYNHSNGNHDGSGNHNGSGNGNSNGKHDGSGNSNSNGNHNGNGNGGNSTISVDEAKQIALNHANLSASQVSFSKAQMERDDGQCIYEIEFYYNNAEYEYEINACTGKIIDCEKEIDD